MLSDFYFRKGSAGERRISPIAINRSGEASAGTVVVHVGGEDG